jgi:seryl-tRNA synthetase
MHDIRAIRADPAGFEAALARRGVTEVDGMRVDAGRLVGLDQERRNAITALEELRSMQNRIAKDIGAARGRGEDTSELMARVAGAKQREADVNEKVKRAEVDLAFLLDRLPNTLDPDVPDGADESANIVLHQHGDIPAFAFTPRQHFELGEALGLMDFAMAAKLAGARFTVLKGALARLERALGQWMLTLHTEQHGYTECSVPLLVNNATMYGSGQLPKFAEEAFRTTDEKWLIPTSEVPLANFAAGEILAEADLPLRLTALTPCFRSEAGSAGRDTRGMLRQHQFHKVELISITTPEQSAAEHERMTRCAERVLTDLGLTWRRVFLCAGDTGFGAARTYDIEVWLPGQGAWREISSCSNCRDFQARRMNGRFKPKDGKSNLFLHTLNGSGVAVGRALIAVLETFQQEDGSVLVPEVLRPWMGGIERVAR